MTKATKLPCQGPPYETTRVRGRPEAHFFPAPRERSVLEDELEAVTPRSPSDLTAVRLRASSTEEPIRDREIEESGGDSMLARYFREMATHAVMGQEEELATAIEVEKAEIATGWRLLAHMPAAPTSSSRSRRICPTG